MKNRFENRSSSGHLIVRKKDAYWIKWFFVFNALEAFETWMKKTARTVGR